MVPVLFAVVRAGEIVAVGSRPEMQAFCEAYRGRSQNVPFSQVSIEPVKVRLAGDPMDRRAAEYRRAAALIDSQGEPGYDERRREARRILARLDRTHPEVAAR